MMWVITVSTLYILSVALAVALNMNRVLVMDRNNVTGHSRIASKNSYQVNNTFCILQKKEDLVIISTNLILYGSTLISYILLL